MVSSKQIHRVNLQEAIIGAVLVENCMAEVHTILTPYNFIDTEAPYKLIWKCLSEMYPTKPIDIITATHELRKFSPELNWAKHITRISSRINSAANIHYHAFCLLELDIEEKLMEELAQARYQYLQVGDMVAVEKVNTIISDMEFRPGRDLLKDIEQISLFVHHHQLQKCNDIAEYTALIAKKARSILSTATEQAMFNHLKSIKREGLAQYPRPIQQLISITAQAMQQTQYPKGTFAAIDQLNKLYASW